MKIFTDKKIEELYRLLDVPMLDFDCGQLCAPENDGIPICCDQRTIIPILYADELRWHRQHGKFWKRMPKRGKAARELAEMVEDDIDHLAVCLGPSKCERSKRAFVCRVFPFEPHCDSLGRVLGLTYTFSKDHPCPLVKMENVPYNPEFIQNCIRFWRELFKLIPRERDLYREESKRMQRRFQRKGRKIPIFR